MCSSLWMVSFNLLLTKKRRIHEAAVILQLLQTRTMPLIAKTLPYLQAQTYKDSHNYNLKLCCIITATQANAQTHRQAHTKNGAHKELIPHIKMTLE